MNRLSPVDLRMADCLVQGMSNQEISETTHLKLRTVKAHMNRMFREFGVNSGVKRVKLAVILWREMNTKNLPSETEGSDRVGS